MKNHLYWEIPSSIDLEDFLKRHPPRFKYKKDHFYYIIDYLSRGLDAEDLDKNAGFINLNAKRLQTVNHNYKKYIDHLLEFRFIRTDKKYIVGKKSFGYRLNDRKYLKATLKKIAIEDYVVNRKKYEEDIDQSKKLNDTRKHYPYLTKWFDQLEIDVAGASTEVERLYPEKTSGIRGTRKGKANDWEKRYKAIYAITKINNKEFFYNADANVGRFHSNLTNLKKEIRNYITYNGQKLVNIDLKNSQPLFSSLLFKKEFYLKEEQYLNVYMIPSVLPLLSSNRHSYSITIIMIVETLEKAVNQDIDTYLKLVKSGEFYKKISEMMYPKLDFDKNAIKMMTYIVYFSSNRFIGQNGAEPKRIFRKLFPNTYEVFRIIKQKNHTALAHLLQRIESIVMIENVVPRIVKERPELPIFTIHDSIVTTVGNENYIANVIKEEILRLTGLEAEMSYEYWLNKNNPNTI